MTTGSDESLNEQKMSNISYEKFQEWARKRFPDAKIKDGKVKINSLFCDHLGGDQKYHLWCKPEINHFRCWKSGVHGNLFQLIVTVENCSYSEAKRMMGVGSFNLAELEKRVDELLGVERPNAEEPAISTIKGISLPPFTHLISELPPGLKAKRLATEYLQARKLSTTGLYFCIKEDYRNRIIIPYFDKEGNLTYWNGRDITGNSNLRYRGPEKIEGVFKEHNVFASIWPTDESKVYITEGEFDALSLNVFGLYGMALGGKEMNDKQIDLLEKYHIVLAFDNDLSGWNATLAIGNRLRNRNINKVSRIFPAKGFKDWNEMLQKLNPPLVRSYILKNEKPFDPTPLIEMGATESKR